MMRVYATDGLWWLILIFVHYFCIVLIFLSQGGAIGGCQVTSSGVSFNMGYIHGRLVATEPNTLTMQYDNGDICNKGTDKESHRSTRIVFYCNSRVGSCTLFQWFSTSWDSRTTYKSFLLVADHHWKFIWKIAKIVRLVCLYPDSL